MDVALQVYPFRHSGIMGGRARTGALFLLAIGAGCAPGSAGEESRDRRASVATCADDWRETQVALRWRRCASEPCDCSAVTCESLGRLPKAARVRRVMQYRGWAKVRYQGTTGWCADQYLVCPSSSGPASDPAGSVVPTTAPSGGARIGLHASADPGDLSAAELAEFALLRPSIIKVLSSHSEGSISALASQHPEASFIVRASLDFSGRALGPEEFVRYTEYDVRRALRVLAARDVVVELHNEPNLTLEGLGTAWQDGESFGTWFLEVLRRYRELLPATRFIYPGLSPGGDIAGLRMGHEAFLQRSRGAVLAADGLGVHLYWRPEDPLPNALGVLDAEHRAFPKAAVWVTEASIPGSGVTPEERATEYLRLWRELLRRPLVQGVTFFVASASHPGFAEEAWLGKGIAARLGQR